MYCLRCFRTTYAASVLLMSLTYYYAAYVLLRCFCTSTLLPYYLCRLRTTTLLPYYLCRLRTTTLLPYFYVAYVLLMPLAYYYAASVLLRCLRTTLCRLRTSYASYVLLSLLTYFFHCYRTITLYYAAFDIPINCLLTSCLHLTDIYILMNHVARTSQTCAHVI